MTDGLILTYESRLLITLFRLQLSAVIQFFLLVGSHENIDNVGYLSMLLYTAAEIMGSFWSVLNKQLLKHTTYFFLMTPLMQNIASQELIFLTIKVLVAVWPTYILGKITILKSAYALGYVDIILGVMNSPTTVTRFGGAVLIQNSFSKGPSWKPMTSSLKVTASLAWKSANHT